MTTTSTPDLIPIKRGAVIDWKATAQQAHDARWAHQTQSEDRKRVIDEQFKQIADLEGNLGAVLASNGRLSKTLQAIRAHWAARFLPRELRG